MTSRSNLVHPLAQIIANHAECMPKACAFIQQDGKRISWSDYAHLSDRIGRALSVLARQRGDRVAVFLPDTPTIHAAFVGAEKAGLVAVGIGARAGDSEIAHLIKKTGACALLTHADMRGRSSEALCASLAEHGVRPMQTIMLPDMVTHPEAPILVNGNVAREPALALDPEQAFRPDELFLINSTSGTTGLPKCVMHNQSRWLYFHAMAVRAAELRRSDVFMSAIPAPFGFGLWTAHFTPTILGCPTVTMSRFDANEALDIIERERVTVLCCVSTQFIMMLNENVRAPRDLSSLRVMFTGGEAVPYDKAAAFEATTGAVVLQFYGSNETGALSGTRMSDPQERRLRSAGRLLEDMDVRLFDPDTGDDITGRSKSGQPGCRGPVVCLGYWDDPEANSKLYSRTGYMLMGDIVEIDEGGYLSVIGRTSDFIIRGGKNISAAAVEAEVAKHPAVALVAAVAAPDPVFGERVCIYVTPAQGQGPTLEEINALLIGNGVSREWCPEYLVLMDELPRASGGKIAKGTLREDARRRFDPINRQSRP